jgi:putative serine protease PepD
MLDRHRTLATFAAVLAVGAGGGATAAALIDGSSHTTTYQPVAASSSTASATTTAGRVYSSARQGVVEIVAGNAEGSGFVIDTSGHIVTNQHVVDGANSIQVKFADGTKASATVVGADPSSDVAVLKVGVDSSKLHPLSFGDSSKVGVGDPVVAIGSPYGLDGSLTAGIVSALDRTITAPNNYSISGAIQTDAPINHGNSGGPLLNAAGQVIGVTAQIESGSGDNSGVGFALASNAVKQVADQIVAGQNVTHPYLGLQLTDAAGGATVAAVTDGSPAGSVDIRRGDVVTQIDGKSVGSSAAVIAAVQSHKPGDKLAITLRRSGQSQSVSVTLGDKSQ